MRQLLLFFLAASLAGASEDVAPVRTESGLVSGSGTDVRVYRGIPYAAPPTGSLRWKPPAPPLKWEGVRTATEFGPACPQTGLGVLGGKRPKTSEDCLTLNIWTPARTPRAKLPVMVSIHGGAFAIGWSGVPAYDGELLARMGVVVVSINYRLGVFGFLAHPGLVQESPRRAAGNYGLMDQIAALQWIQRNIGGFGGDPKRVTIFGESAGGSSVCYLLVSPLSKGLFHRAIAQSPGALYMPIGRLEQAAKSGAEFAVEVEALRTLSTEELLKKVTPSNAAIPAGMQFQPIIDGWVLPDDPATAFDSGRAHRVPLIAGINSDDGGLFMLVGPVRTVPALQGYLKKRFGESANRALELYPASSDTEAQRVVRQVATDVYFGLGTREVLTAISRAKRAYWYQFTRIDPVSKRLGGYGALHAVEVGCTFGDCAKSVYAGTPLLPASAAGGFDDTDRALAKAMSGAWVRFAATGDPNGPGLPKWPAFDPRSPQYLEYGDTMQPRRAGSAARLDFLKDFYARERRAGKTQ